MIVDRAWIARNIGVDPATVSIPKSAFATRAAATRDASLDDIQRDIIDFDSEGPEGSAFLAFTKATGLSRFVDIPWPKGLAPTPAARGPTGGAKPLPRADVLIVTWTVDEGHALSRVLTPGKDSRNDYVAYAHNFSTLSRQMSKGSPAVKAKRLGAFWTTTIGGKKVVLFKSESHLSQDTFKHLPANGVLPNAELWKQIIGEVRPKLVLTTGTAGGIGKQFEVGDVIVSPVVRFDSTSWLKKASFASAHYASNAAQTKFFSQAKDLFKANASQLPADNIRPPAITIVTPLWVFPSRSSPPTSSAFLTPRMITSSFRASGTHPKWETQCLGWSPSRLATHHRGSRSVTFQILRSRRKALSSSRLRRRLQFIRLTGVGARFVAPSFVGPRWPLFSQGGQGAQPCAAAPQYPTVNRSRMCAWPDCCLCRPNLFTTKGRQGPAQTMHSKIDTGAQSD